MRKKDEVRVKSGPRMDGTKSLAQRRTVTLFPDDLNRARKLIIKHDLANLAELVRFLILNG